MKRVWAALLAGAAVAAPLLAMSEPASAGPLDVPGIECTANRNTVNYGGGTRGYRFRCNWGGSGLTSIVFVRSDFVAIAIPMTADPGGAYSTAFEATTSSPAASDPIPGFNAQTAGTCTGTFVTNGAICYYPYPAALTVVAENANPTTVPGAYGSVLDDAPPPTTTTAPPTTTTAPPTTTTAPAPGFDAGSAGVDGLAASVVSWVVAYALPGLVLVLVLFLIVALLLRYARKFAGAS